MKTKTGHLPASHVGEPTSLSVEVPRFAIPTKSSVLARLAKPRGRSKGRFLVGNWKFLTFSCKKVTNHAYNEILLSAMD